MRLTVDPWDPAYGTSAAEATTETDATIDLAVECSAESWAPVHPPAEGTAVPGPVLFVDGVRRIDARVWVDDGTGTAPEAGLAASWAAGVVVCDGTARVASVEVGRGLFSASAAATDVVTMHGRYERQPARSGTPEHLSLALQQAMAQSEVAVAVRSGGHDAGLLVVDGPLRGRQHLHRAIGMIKTHHTAYLEAGPRGVLNALRPGERTPVFRIASAWIRHSWYVRLPGGGEGPMAGIVRCECSAELAASAAVELATCSAAVLPVYASSPHKDARAPQNLYPIGGLERELRRRLGDAGLL